MTLTLVTPPANEPLSLADAKAHLRVDHSDEDTLINALIAAAREDAEDFRNQSFITQTWKLTLDVWPTEPDVIELPRGPVSVTSVKYTDEDGNTSTFASSNYVEDLESEPARLALKRSASWPSDTLQVVNGIEVTYVAGYGDDASDVPAAVVEALKLMIGHYYENREATITGTIISRIPLGAQHLLWKKRVKQF